jgi:hypothetical protein
MGTLKNGFPVVHTQSSAQALSYGWLTQLFEHSHRADAKALAMGGRVLTLIIKNAPSRSL